MTSAIVSGLLSLLRGDRKLAKRRENVRVACIHVATLRFVEGHFDIDGLVVDVSVRGVLFRPATRYVLKRAGDAVRVRIGDIEVAGIIRNTSERGYGILLSTPLEKPALDHLVATGLSSLTAKAA